MVQNYMLFSQLYLQPNRWEWQPNRRKSGAETGVQSQRAWRGGGGGRGGEGGGRGALLIVSGWSRPLTLFQTKIYDFPYPISDTLRAKRHPYLRGGTCTGYPQGGSHRLIQCQFATCNNEHPMGPKPNVPKTSFQTNDHAKPGQFQFTQWYSSIDRPRGICPEWAQRMSRNSFSFILLPPPADIARVTIRCRSQ